MQSRLEEMIELQLSMLDSTKAELLLKENQLNLIEGSIKQSRMALQAANDEIKHIKKVMKKKLSAKHQFELIEISEESINDCCELQSDIDHIVGIDIDE